MKTIRQIADECGVTKQAVHQRIKRKPLSTSLHKHLKTVDGIIYINVDGENIIKEAFIKKEPSPENDIEKKDSDDMPNKDVDALTEDIDELTQTFTKTFTKNVDADITMNYINSLKENISALKENNKILLQELNKNRESLEREREHSRNQSDKILGLADQLAELNKNNQVLLREAQDKNAILLPDQFNDTVSGSTEKKKSLFRLFFKKT